MLFPNPIVNANEVHLEPALAYIHYTLTNVVGRVLQQQAGTLSRVSLVDLPAGVYLLVVQTEAGPKTFRLLR